MRPTIFFVFVFMASCFFASGTEKYGPPISQEELEASDKIPDETPEQIKEDKKIEEEEDGPEDRFVVLDPNNEEDRNVIIDSRRKWPNNIVPYKISSTFDNNARLYVAKAIRAFQRHTCIRFRDATYQDMSDDGGYIEFVRESGCWSFVGYLGKNSRKENGNSPKENGSPPSSRQRVSLGKGCLHTTTALHEVMHALGFSHEQSRPDRDEYLNIIWNNIIPAKKDQYKIEKESTTYDTDYDYCSIMQYEQGSFGQVKNGKTLMTMVVKKPNKKCSDSLGLTPHLTDGDIKKINKLYECEGLASVDNNIKTKSRICFDEKSESECKENAAWGYCEGTGETNVDIRHGCQKTCNLCNGKEKTDVCFNYEKDNLCEKYKCRGYCKATHKYYNYMKKRCRKSCNFCNGGAGNPEICDVFEAKKCQDYADDDGCKVNHNNYAFMQENCAKTCKTYKPVCKDKKSEQECNQLKCSGSCTKGKNNYGYATHYCKKSCQVCDGKTAPEFTCDALSKSECKNYVNRGYCKGTNEAYMQENCKASCKEDTTTTTTTTTTTKAPMITSECKDKYKSCGAYKRFCTDNNYKKWMGNNCAKTCQGCN